MCVCGRRGFSFYYVMKMRNKVKNLLGSIGQIGGLKLWSSLPLYICTKHNDHLLKTLIFHNDDSTKGCELKN